MMYVKGILSLIKYTGFSILNTIGLQFFLTFIEDSNNYDKKHDRLWEGRGKG